MFKLCRKYALSLFIASFLLHFCQSYVLPPPPRSATVSAYEHYMLALRLSEENRYEEALAEIDLALAVNSRMSIFHSFKGDLLVKLDRIDEAITNYGRVLTFRDNEPLTLEKLARLYLEKQRYDLALVYIKKAYIRDSKKISLLLDMAEYELLLGNAERAYNYAQQYRQLCRDEEHLPDRYYCVLGRFYFGRKNFADAVKYYEKRRDCASLSADDLNALLKSYFHLNRLEDAFNLMMQLNTDQLAAGDLNYFRGLYYYHGKNLNDAKMQLEMALHNDCGETTIYYYLGKIYLNENDVARARIMFSRFRELSSDFDAIQSIDPDLLIEE